MQNLVAKTGESVVSGQPLVTASFIFGFIVALTIHQVLMKLASYHDDIWWFIYMGIGYAVGIFPPLFLALAYSGNNPVIILAIASGLGTPIVYTTLLLLFEHTPMSSLQWTGIVLAIIASVLLTLGPVQDPHSTPTGDDEKAAATEALENGKTSL